MFILKEVKVIRFDTLSQVLILKVVRSGSLGSDERIQTTKNWVRDLLLEARDTFQQTELYQVVIELSSENLSFGLDTIRP